jgi:putative colanic acid biosynthesis acetyltransferase WcaF
LLAGLAEIGYFMRMSNKNSQHAFRVDLTKSKTKWDTGTILKRIVWQFILRPVFMLLPRWGGNSARIFLLRILGAKIGEKCLIEPGVNVLMPWNLTLEPHVSIGRDVEIYNYARVEIGSMTVISQYSYLCTGTHDYTHPHMPLTWAPITIGSECWVAADVFIGPGVHIGNGAVIGARSVVTKVMPEWMVCAGNPCRPIKRRILKNP